MEAQTQLSHAHDRMHNDEAARAGRKAASSSQAEIGSSQEKQKESRHPKTALTFFDDKPCLEISS
jgi:hypothetical protein